MTDPMPAPTQTPAMKRAFRFKGYIDNTEHRAITSSQLDAVLRFAEEHCCEWCDTAPRDFSLTAGQVLTLDILNLYHLNTWLIRPSTHENDCAFVELVATTEQIPSWFVSHWWGERIKDFIACITQHCLVRKLSDEVGFWVCAYANRQHSLYAELVEDVTKTSFYKAMERSHGVLLVLDARNDTSGTGPATPFKRIWCAFEEYLACVHIPDVVFDIASHDGERAHVITDGFAEVDLRLGSKFGAELKASRESWFPIHVIRAGLVASLEQAKASMESDRVRILNWITGNSSGLAPPDKHENYDKINRTLRGIFAIAVWRQAVEKGMVEELMLHAVLAADVNRKELELDFSLSEFCDSDAKALANGFPPRLELLQCFFKCCKKLGDEGLESLGVGLPSTLHTLRLIFAECTTVGDVGMSALGRHLPSTLRILRLSFVNCSGITDAGLSAVATGLTPCIQHIILDVSYSHVGDRGLSALAAKLPPTLRTLDLYGQGCCAVGDGGFAALAQSLAPGLEVLQLGFAGCPSVSNAAVARIAVNLPSSIGVLGVRLSENPRIDDAAVAALVARLPECLKTLEVTLFRCSVTDISAKSFATGLPAGVQNLLLDLRTTPGSQLYFDSADDLRKWSASMPDVVAVEPAVAPLDLQIATPAKPFDKKAFMKKKSRALFDKYDKNKSGKLSRPEFERVLTELSNSKISRRECQVMFRRFDKNHDGQISFDEFLDFLYQEP